ncbi:hypothetical protein A3C20_00460 [Candidatus Kaiserbacteria bacterium RIFCSPHIGHO2_02_FULL_55_25]|uniref:ATP-grasp domain-containing protein n=1 Tax=Candidatus Kaiserbacteria bacterium RIFCSPHIGHO2_02_FULL_55_25 TaxID=1798498 RepID=A0A1F6E589_9BACT|nr:MAG: hypothetical protein A2764_02105 [Candidatus Kaiserbacteria bacterium RIFCSPHIGHO2_01_FULL_55_79]OGG68828.1 MAG: hypothetical protein A3C20_00460 [Candidatus Kaiserbacteria bacterium RIFCSPHIGHO2_02_FULL_55_25]OGG77302.1 MAG: hypothetical protein A3F56_04550 [Candidatus Kaiserbacteria bacterium RIFCSPHIGHO2_12_FULL_55_13]OGG84161.1 MAG: hypothetical protein A3A42_01540 [Candidatus Kaiserbacteria bacterium RIFCSPLOWO2_01_FULL_55_25]
MRLALRDSQDVYNLLNHATIWHRLGVAEEVGHSALYLPYCSVLRQKPEVGADRVQALIEEFAMLYGMSGISRSIMPGNGQDHFEIIETIRKLNPIYQHLLFEGYEIASEQENASVHRDLARRARERGYMVTISSGSTVDRWNAKPYFRDRVVKALGHGAVPPGVHLDSPQHSEEIIQAIQNLFKTDAERVVVKISGSGGKGNTILTRGEDVQSASKEIYSRLLAKNEKWVAVEAWIPWQTTGCCSFFLADNHAPIPMTLVEQVLSPISAGFIGSKSLVNITSADQQAINDLTARIVNMALVEGIRGFCGVDFIISLPGRTKNELLLPSGLALRYIEATPRIGAHNQEMKALSMIATREGAAVDDFVHVRVCNNPIPGTTSRGDLYSWFAQALRDLAEPLTEQFIDYDTVHFLLDCNFGQDLRTRYDAIMFVCRRGRAEVKLRAAFSHLQSLGVLQT